MFEIGIAEKRKVNFFFVRVRTVVKIMFGIMNAEFESAGDFINLFIAHLGKQDFDIVIIWAVSRVGFVFSKNGNLTEIMSQ